MIGITSEFTAVIDNCEANPTIRWIQILFCQRNKGIYYPDKEELRKIRNYLRNKGITPIIHISMGHDPKWWNNGSIHPTIANYYGYFRKHILREIYYGKEIDAQYIVIHCGSKGGRNKKKKEIPENKFLERLTQLVNESPIRILIENSASKRCFGSTFEELLRYIHKLPNIAICYDTMHHYGAGNEINLIPNILKHKNVECIHVNDIPLKVTHGSGEDEHESLHHGVISTYDKGFKFEHLKNINKPKILETPRKEFWKDELRLINNMTTEVIKVHSVPTLINGKKVEGIVDSGAEWTLISERALSRIDPKGQIPTTTPIDGFKLKSANAEMPIKKWILATINIGTRGEFTKKHKIPVVSQGREVLIGLEILNNEFDIMLTPINKFLRTKNGQKIPLQQRKDILLSEVLCQHVSKDDVMFKVWKLGDEASDWLKTEITDTEKILGELEFERQKLTQNRPKKSVSSFGRGYRAQRMIDEQLDLITKDILDQEKYVTMLKTILEKIKYQRIREERLESQDQVKILRDFMEEQKRKAEEKKARMATEWNKRIEQENVPIGQQTYPAQNFMKNWYHGNFDWKNPRNDYERTLLEMRPRSRPRSQSRSRPRSRPRSQSRSRPRSRPRSQSRSRPRSRPRSQSRSRPRSRSQHKRAGTPIPRKRLTYAITRQQSRNIRTHIPTGTRIPNRQIPPNNTQIRITPRLSSTDTNSSGVTTSTTTRNSTPSRGFTPASGYGTPRSSDRSRSGSQIPSLRPSRQTSPIPPQSSRSSSTRQTTQSSQGPQLVPLWKANAGIVINGEVNGRRLQIIFSTIHKRDFMTESTANWIGFPGIRMMNDHYLEDTYMDHRYGRRTSNPINIIIGQDPNRNDLFITTDDHVIIVRDDNFYNRSQSLQDPRNRRYILLGLDTIQQNGLIIKLKELTILYPNPNYQPNPEKRYFRIEAMQYPDLSVQRNRDFHVRNINKF